jgi:hypothetical protein
MQKERLNMFPSDYPLGKALAQSMVHFCCAFGEQESDNKDCAG